MRLTRLVAAGLRYALRLRPLPLQMALLLTLAGLISVDQAASRRVAAVQAARHHYIDALSATRAQLAGLLGQTVSDKALAQNLNWRLTHSVQSSLQARLQTGGLNQIILWDKNCHELARVKSGRGGTPPCPFANADAESQAERFQWVASDFGPMLTLLRQVPGVTGDPVYALGAVTLDDDWLAIYPELKNAMQALDLRIGIPDEDATVLVAEGADAASRLTAALLGNEAWAGFLSGNKQSPVSKMFYPMLFAALLLAGWTWLRERSEHALDVKRRASLQRWVQNLIAHGQAPATESSATHPDDIALQTLLSGAFKRRAEELCVVSRRLQAAEAELKHKDQEQKKLRQRLAELAELDSLADQLARTTGAFLEKMSHFHEQAEDLIGLTESGSGPCARLLTKTLNEWRAGIEERGARKFLRGLSETPGLAETGKTRLDEDLDLLATLVRELDDQALATTTQARALIDMAAFAAKIAGLWHGIALKTHADKSTHDILQPLEEAQELIRLEHPATNFLNRIPADEARKIPALPRTIWVTALYHVYLALAELARGTDAVIATRLRKEDDKCLLVVQVAAQNGAQLPRRGESEAYHLEISRSILAPFPVSLSVLPSLAGPFPIAVSWSLAAVNTTAPETLRERRDGAPKSTTTTL